MIIHIKRYPKGFFKREDCWSGKKRCTGQCIYGKCIYEFEVVCYYWMLFVKYSSTFLYCNHFTSNWQALFSIFKRFRYFFHNLFLSLVISSFFESFTQYFSSKSMWFFSIFQKSGSFHPLFLCVLSHCILHLKAPAHSIGPAVFILQYNVLCSKRTG